MSRFALIGAAGFVAPRHMKAIKEVGGTLVAACDPHDSVGVLDSYAPECQYFREVERFERFLYKYPVDYVAICTPNYMHDSHIRMALHAGAHAICEKPLVINPWNLDELEDLERRTGKTVSTVLQLREHNDINRMRAACADGGQIQVDYFTPRGAWYAHSWKGDEEKSGGLGMNLGVHLFDLVVHLLGKPDRVKLSDKRPAFIRGQIDHVRGTTNFCLSTSDAGKARRLFQINGQPFELTDQFNSLHTKVYTKVLAGRGVRPADVRDVIKLVYDVRYSGTT
jgi:UDP-N-acetyl-2-amino-2-deoxyglucuronate dehydrogenase